MIRKCVISEVLKIQRILDHYGDRGILLPRSLSELYEHLRDFYVATDDTMRACDLNKDYMYKEPPLYQIFTIIRQIKISDHHENISLVYAIYGESGTFYMFEEGLESIRKKGK